MGALRTSMATCGYRDIAEFNRAELMVAPALQTEGKHLQREQGVGMGASGPEAADASVSPTEPAEPAAVDEPAATARRAVDESALDAEPSAPTDEVVVLDYGGQYSQLIARRVRECGVFSELLPHHVGAAEVARRRPKGVILSGRPGVGLRRRRAAARAARCSSSAFPVLGICYGMQLHRARARRARRGRGGRRVRPLAADGARARPAAGRHAARADVLDVPPRHASSRRRPASPRWPPRPASPVAAFESDASAACTASSSTPRSSTRPTASRCSRTS